MNTTTTDEKLTIRQSRLNDFLLCGLKTKYAIEGYERERSPNLTIGTSVHWAVEAVLRGKLDGNDVSEEETKDLAAQKWDIEAPSTTFKTTDDKDDLKDKAIALSALYHKEVAPKIDPKFIEHQFELVGEELVVTGTIDVIEKNGVIRDTKTSKSRYHETSIYTDIQPALYDFAYQHEFGKRSTGFAYDVLLKNKTPKVQTIGGELTKWSRERVFKVISAFVKTYKSGLWAPTGVMHPWACNYCGYKYMCEMWKGERHGRKSNDTIDSGSTENATGHSSASGGVPAGEPSEANGAAETGVQPDAV